MIDITLLKVLFGKMEHRVKYRLGAKARFLGIDSNEITHLDCSGAVRYWVYRITSGKIVLPDGSSNQLDYAKKHFKKVSFQDVQMAEDHDKLFIGFMTPTDEQRRLNAMDDRARGRHVWLAIRGKTMESRGGKGVSSQPIAKYANKIWFEVTA